MAGTSGRMANAGQGVDGGTTTSTEARFLGEASQSLDTPITGRIMRNVDLTSDEKNLFDQIDFTGREYCAEQAHKLAKSLFERDAIPAIRLEYFTSPQYNIQGRGESRLKNWERKNLNKDEIFKHPHFIKYLQYFIKGPNISPEHIYKFEELVKKLEPITSGDTNDLCSLAKKQAKSSGKNTKDEAEEYYKLCLELGIYEGTARDIRKAVLNMK